MKVLVVLFMSVLFVSCASKKKDGTASTAETNPVTTEEKKGKVKTAASADSITCSTGSDIRTIEVVVVGNGCEVRYAKFGETNTVATSVNGTAHCKTVQERIKNNLEGAGHSCK